MSSLEATIKLQISRANFIESTHKELMVVDAPKLGLAALETKLEMLQNYWDKLETTHEKIVGGSAKLEGLLSLPYFKDQIFDQSLAHYAAAKVMLTERMEKEGAANGSHSRRSTLPSSQSSSSSRRALPEISLPKFSGIYAEWRSFRDLFSSLVGSNPELSNVERMHYLRTSLSSEPSRLISNLTVSDESFVTAWDLLTSRYENKRLLVSAHLDQLLSPAPMTAHNSKELNRLVTGVSEALSALKALGEPTDSWGSVVVHTVVHRLSSKLREAWENKVGAQLEYPTFVQLLEFLQGRARAMESLEIGSTTPGHSKPTSSPARSSRPSASVNVATHSRPALHRPSQPQQRQAQQHQIQSTASPSWAELGRYPCSYCQGEHYISSCNGFRNLTPIARKEVIERLYLCFNCLGKHSIRVCQTTKTCSTCHERHHTLIHIDRRSPSQHHGPAQRRSNGPAPERRESPAPATPSTSAEASANGPAQ